MSDTIEIVATPGHTLSCVSVLVRQSNLAAPNPSGIGDDKDATGTTVAIVGDLFERRDDIADSALWLDAGSEDPTAQRRNRARMAAIADYLVPGHGPMFAVDEQVRAELKRQAGGEDEVEMMQNAKE